MVRIFLFVLANLDLAVEQRLLPFFVGVASLLKKLQFVGVALGGRFQLHLEALFLEDFRLEVGFQLEDMFVVILLFYCLLLGELREFDLHFYQFLALCLLAFVNK